MARTKGSTNKPKEEPKTAKVKYWFGTVFIHGVGNVSGPVREDHYQKFIENFESGCKASGLAEVDWPKLDENYWIRDVDELEVKRQKDRKRKQEIK